MKFYFTFVALFVSVLSCGFAQEVAVNGSEADQAQIETAAQRFVELYNAHDVKTLSSLFVSDAELVERDGTRFVGSEEIQSAFENSFAENPKAKLSLAIESLRFIAPGVAIEEGQLTWFPDGVEATVESIYRVAHVKRNDKWLMAGARTIDEDVLTNYEYLRDLEWLVGDWIDEDSEAVVETSFRWAPNKAFLLRDFSVRSKGQVVLSGTQRIGWDAQKKQFRSWTFDSEGGYVEGIWTAVGDGYVIRSSGYNSDGLAVSGTTRFDREGKDRFIWSMFNRLRGSEIMPDARVTIARKPPQPKVAQN